MPSRTTRSWLTLSLPLAALALLLAVSFGPALDGRAPSDVPGTPAADLGSWPTSNAADGGLSAQPTPERAPPDDGARPRSDGGTSGGDEGAAPTDHFRGGMRLTASHPDVAPVIAIQERHNRDLMKHPLVVGTATGMDARGNIAVVVLTSERADDLPDFLDGAPVVQHVTGKLVASKGGPPAEKGGGGSTSVDPTARFDRPVPIGVSTGHVDITAGTISCRVVAGGSAFALSNNHVYANANDGQVGDLVLQPGPYDGGSSATDDIGTLADFEPLKFDGSANTIDAAIAATDAATLDNATPSDGYGTPRSATVTPAISERVMKYGRTTGLTNGKIYAINASVNVGYGSSGTAYFTGQIVITPGSVSQPGDSGSLFVVQKGGDARKPVGLLFAGGFGATIANPIDSVLARFGVSVDGD